MRNKKSLTDLVAGITPENLHGEWDTGAAPPGENDFRKGKGGNAKRYVERTNVILLDSDVAAHFPDAASVNEALRALVKIARGIGKKAPR